MRPLADRLAARVAEVGTATCLGLDPHPGRVPGTTPHGDREQNAAAVRSFCLRAVDEAAETVAAVKPQAAFFEALGGHGVRVLEEVVAHARRAGLFVLLDAKRGDIGSTAEAYAHATLDDAGPLGADAVTVSPYLGPESLAPFAARADQGKGVFVLLRTSNPGAGPWQRDLKLADAVAGWLDEHVPHAGAVVGATLAPAEIERWRARLPHTWLLAPGFGAQGAGIDALRRFFPAGAPVRALVPASRSVLFPRAGEPDGGLGSRLRAFTEAVAEAGGRARSGP